MWRQIRATLAPLPALVKQVRRIADALERAYPPATASIEEPTVSIPQPHDYEREAARVAAWEAEHGRLPPGRQPPDDFELKDDAAVLKEFFGEDRG